MDKSVLDDPTNDRLKALETELIRLEFEPLIRRLQERTGWSQNRIAEAAEIDQAYFSRLLRGVGGQLFHRDQVEALLQDLEDEKILADAAEREVWRKALRVAAFVHWLRSRVLESTYSRIADVVERLGKIEEAVRRELSHWASEYDDTKGLVPVVVPLMDLLVERIKTEYGWVHIPEGFELRELGGGEYLLVRGHVAGQPQWGAGVKVERSPAFAHYRIRREGVSPQVSAGVEPPVTKPPPDRLPERRTTRFIEPELIRIPAGSFWMGSDAFDKEADADEKPRHSVTLPDYYIARYTVTNTEYELFLADNPLHRTPLHFNGLRAPAGKGLHPVVHVDWHDALAYCRWLSTASGREYRLPSEAEWEKAARGTDGRIYPWGSYWDSTRCNNSDSKTYGTTPVGQYSALGGDSPFGVADMAGNVWEWCQSQFEKYPYNAKDGREKLDGKGSRVLRGGSFFDSRGGVRCAGRSRRAPDYRHYFIGFRVCVVSPGAR